MHRGVYLIKFGDNSYIGSTEKSFSQRKSSHLRELKNNEHGNYKLQNLYNELGKEAFEFIILFECEVDIKLEEQKLIDELRPNLNIAKTTDCPMKGRKHSKETLEKMCGKIPWNRGIPRTKEEKELMSKVKLERMKSRPPEYFEELSRRGKEQNPQYFKGKHHTEETKKSLRNSWIKKYPSVLCEQTGEIFECQKDAAIKYDIKQGHISEQLNGKRKSVKGYTFKYVK